MRIKLIIDRLIEERGLKHGYIAKKLNISERTLYKWRKGETLPRLDKAVELAELLGVKITNIFEKE